MDTRNLRLVIALIFPLILGACSGDDPAGPGGNGDGDGNGSDEWTVLIDIAVAGDWIEYEDSPDSPGDRFHSSFENGVLKVWVEQGYNRVIDGSATLTSKHVDLTNYSEARLRFTLRGYHSTPSTANVEARVLSFVPGTPGQGLVYDYTAYAGGNPTQPQEETFDVSMENALGISEAALEVKLWMDCNDLWAGRDAWAEIRGLQVVVKE